MAHLKIKIKVIYPTGEGKKFPWNIRLIFVHYVASQGVAMFKVTTAKTLHLTPVVFNAWQWNALKKMQKENMTFATLGAYLETCTASHSVKEYF